MTEKIKEMIIEKILSLVCISLTSGSISSVVAKHFETKVFGNLSLSVLITIGIVVASAVYFIYQSINARKQRARAEYNKILKDIDDILDLKNWDDFVQRASKDKFLYKLHDQFEAIKKYKDEKYLFWPNDDKRLKLLINDLINCFSSMYAMINKHFIPDIDCTILYPNDFSKTSDESQREAKENEYLKYLGDVWKTVKDYCDLLNRIAVYVHNKKYDCIGTSWEGLFLMQ